MERNKTDTHASRPASSAQGRLQPALAQRAQPEGIKVTMGGAQLSRWPPERLLALCQRVANSEQSGSVAQLLLIQEDPFAGTASFPPLLLMSTGPQQTQVGAGPGRVSCQAVTGMPPLLRSQWPRGRAQVQTDGAAEGDMSLACCGRCLWRWLRVVTVTPGPVQINSEIAKI